MLENEEGVRKLKELLKLLQPEFPEKPADLESEVGVEFREMEWSPLEDDHYEIVGRLAPIKDVKHNSVESMKVHILI